MVFNSEEYVIRKDTLQEWAFGHNVVVLQVWEPIKKKIKIHFKKDKK